jgi:hypothetical protein
MTVTRWVVQPWSLLLPSHNGSWTSLRDRILKVVSSGRLFKKVLKKRWGTVNQSESYPSNRGNHVKQQQSFRLPCCPASYSGCEQHEMASATSTWWLQHYLHRLKGGTSQMTNSDWDGDSGLESSSRCHWALCFASLSVGGMGGQWEELFFSPLFLMFSPQFCIVVFITFPSFFCHITSYLPLRDVRANSTIFCELGPCRHAVHTVKYLVMHCARLLNSTATESELNRWHNDSVTGSRDAPGWTYTAVTRAFWVCCWPSGQTQNKINSCMLVGYCCSMGFY